MYHEAELFTMKEKRSNEESSGNLMRRIHKGE